MANSSILLIPLFRGLAVTTTGVAPGQQGDKTTLDLDVPRVRNLLPQWSGLFLIGLIEGVPDDQIQFNVTCFSGFDRNHERAGFDIAATSFSTAASNRSVEYTVATEFLLESRLRLWWSNYTGLTGVKTGIISAVLGARLAQA